MVACLGGVGDVLELRKLGLREGDNGYPQAADGRTSKTGDSRIKEIGSTAERSPPNFRISPVCSL
ncbi:hypothetical protein MASR1M101_21050 [Gemmatimonas sp.]